MELMEPHKLLEHDETLTTYSSESTSNSVFGATKRLVLEIKNSRYIIWRLFVRDYRAQFRQKIFGYLWAILTPLFVVSSYLVLYAIGVLNPGVGTLPYTIFLLLGSSIWSCMTSAIVDISSSLQLQADLILKTNIPKISIVISSLVSTMYGMLINMFIVFVVFVIFGFKPSFWFAAYPLLVLPMLMVGAAIGTVLSVIGQIAKDLLPLVLQFLTFVMYLTPVVYEQQKDASGVLQKIVQLNPLNSLVNFPRKLITEGNVVGFDSYLLSTAIALGVLILAIQVFYLLESLVAERL